LQEQTKTNYIRQMKQIEHSIDNEKIVEIISDEIIFNSVDEVIDLMGSLSYRGYKKMIVHEENINKDFFQLKTGLAGAIFQKFVTYKFELAIVGKFEYESKSLSDFIRECNKGGMINFVPDIKRAIER